MHFYAIVVNKTKLLFRLGGHWQSTLVRLALRLP